MKGLKIAAIASVSLLAVMLVLVGYLFLTAKVEVVDVKVVGVPASNDPDAFEQLKASVQQDTFQGTLFQKPTAWKEAEDYVYLTYTLRIRNDCLVPIDMLEVQIVPQSSDILQLGDNSVHSLSMKTEGDLTAQVLSHKNSHSVREIIVTYYLWGISGTLRTVTGQ